MKDGSCITFQTFDLSEGIQGFQGQLKKLEPTAEDGVNPGSSRLGSNFKLHRLQIKSFEGIADYSRIMALSLQRFLELVNGKSAENNDLTSRSTLKAISCILSIK